MEGLPPVLPPTQGQISPPHPTDGWDDVRARYFFVFFLSYDDDLRYDRPILGGSSLQQQSYHANGRTSLLGGRDVVDRYLPKVQGIYQLPKVLNTYSPRSPGLGQAL